MQQPGGQWMLVCPIEQIRLPESLQELILARVDRLEEGLREVCPRAGPSSGGSFCIVSWQPSANVLSTWTKK